MTCETREFQGTKKTQVPFFLFLKEKKSIEISKKKIIAPRPSPLWRPYFFS
jgi:hypothetical protein